MSHEHFHCFVDMLLARPVHIDEVGGAIDGSVAEVRRLQDANAAMLKELKWIAGRIDRNSGSPNFTSDEHDRICAAIAKAEGRS